MAVAIFTVIMATGTWGGAILLLEIAQQQADAEV